jgi:hypothetical protein
MICSECLTRIGELESLERIYAEAQDAFQKIQTEQPEDDLLWAVIQSAKLDMRIARLELKRHQFRHATGKPPGGEKSSSGSLAEAAGGS